MSRAFSRDTYVTNVDMQRLLLLGLNHTTAPLDVRERLAFNDEQRDAHRGELAVGRLKVDRTSMVS